MPDLTAIFASDGGPGLAGGGGETSPDGTIAGGSGHDGYYDTADPHGSNNVEQDDGDGSAVPNLDSDSLLGDVGDGFAASDEGMGQG